MRVITIFLMWALFIFPVIGQGGQAPQFKAGQHYTVLEKDSANISKNNQVTVLEFFTYACKFCYRFDPMVNKWALKHPKIKFDRITHSTQQHWKLLPKAYYTAKVLNREDFHVKLFQGLHQGKFNELSPKSIKSFFLTNGIDEAAYDKALNSPQVKTLEQRASHLFGAYHIRHVPTLVVKTPKGHYLTSPSMAGGLQEVLDVVDFLITKDAS